MKPDALEALGSYYAELLPPAPERRASTWTGLAVPLVAAVGAYVFLGAVSSMPVEAGPPLASPPAWQVAALDDPMEEKQPPALSGKQGMLRRRLWV